MTLTQYFKLFVLVYAVAYLIGWLQYTSPAWRFQTFWRLLGDLNVAELLFNMVSAGAALWLLPSTAPGFWIIPAVNAIMLGVQTWIAHCNAQWTVKRALKRPQSTARILLRCL